MSEVKENLTPTLSLIMRGKQLAYLLSKQISVFSPHILRGNKGGFWISKMFYK
ncbi:hypothetical protein KKB99_02255 [bacterium]|nr:hypothetical protein [bacterium]MBU1024810.1 hypothetical protein [bacterium]